MKAPCSLHFQIGDRVRWVRALKDLSKVHIPGVVLSVIPSDFGLEAFTMYDVQFDFGPCTVYGTQIEPE